MKGREEIQLDGHTIWLDARDSWIVPKGASHSCTVLETLTAIEATYPPAHMVCLDEV